MILNWTQEFSVGIEELDKHHQNIIAILNRLYEAISVGNNSRVVLEILTELSEYANYHFAAEEKLFRQKGYPDAAAHIREHEEFREHLSRIDELAKKKDDFAGLELMEFLSSWLTNHVLTVDMKYVPYLTE